jgi:hypothetical protein
MLVGYAGILLCIVAITTQRKQLTIARLNVLVLLLATHVAASLFYWQWSLTVPADANGYYFDYAGIARGPWGFGSAFVAKLCRFLRVDLGASYAGCFLLFQSFGFIALLVLARVFTEIQEKIVVPQQPIYLALLFLPSVQFWTSAIGKDAPIFLAVALCTWAMLGPRRLLAFCTGMALMVLFRPYMALLAAFALGMSVAMGSRVSLGRKIGIVGAAACSFVLVSAAALSTFGFDATSPSSMSNFLQTQDVANASTLGTTTMANLPLGLRLVSLLFRPLFFDTSSSMGIVASVENVGSILCFLYIVLHWKDLALLVARVPFVRFSLLFAVGIIVVLTLVYFNVGLGLRERVMAYPPIYSILVALWSMRRKRKIALQATPAVQPQTSRTAARLA